MSKGFGKTILQDKILGELNLFLRTKCSDRRAQFVSITKVELDKDKASAKVYWDTFDSKKRGEAKSAMDSMAGALRKHLASVLTIRHIPSLELFYDAQYESEKTITDLLADEARKGKRG